MGSQEGRGCVLNGNSRKGVPFLFYFIQPISITKESIMKAIEKRDWEELLSSIMMDLHQEAIMVQADKKETAEQIAVLGAIEDVERIYDGVE